MTAIAFVVYGHPAPQGSKRHVGGGVMVESSKAVRPWREAVKAAALEAMPAPWTQLSGPLAVRMVFTVAKPHAATIGRRKTEFAPSAKRDDVSKLARSTEDALTDAGVWEDDGLVADYHRQAKVWWGHDPEALPIPGALIAVAEMSACRSETVSSLADAEAAVLAAALARAMPAEIAV